MGLPRPSHQKQPDEARTQTFDFTEKLASGDALTGTPTVAAATGLTAANTVRSGNQVSTRLSGGTDGSDYNVSCQCATTLGDTLELDVLIEVRANVN